MATITTRKWTYKGTIREAYRVTYKDQSGKTATKQFDRRKDAAEFLKTCGALAPADRSKVEFKLVAQRWLDACEKGLGGHVPVEWTTLRNYQGHVKIYINPAFGHMALGEITTQVCGQFRDDLLGRVSRNLAKNVLRSLKAILTQAVIDGHIQINPARELKVVMSKRDDTRSPVPTVEEMQKILAKADELANQPNPTKAKVWRRYRAMVYVSAFTGIRASEMRGLPWRNIDFRTGLLRVSQRADAARIIGSPKSKAGHRVIALAPAIVKLLLEWKAECPPSQANLVFPNWEGNGEAISNIHKRGWYPLQVRAGVVDQGTGQGAYRWHDLRHFRASVLIASGATPKEVMTEMGHGSISLTFDRYGHLFPDTKGERLRRAADIATPILG